MEHGQLLCVCLKVINTGKNISTQDFWDLLFGQFPVENLVLLKRDGLKLLPLHHLGSDLLLSIHNLYDRFHLSQDFDEISLGECAVLRLDLLDGH